MFTAPAVLLLFFFPSITMNDATIHTAFMRRALDEARTAANFGEVPVGAVVVRAGQVIAAGFNRRETRQSPTAHAEILAIEAAAEVLGSWRLDDCTLYVTLEPCPMCAGAILLARVPRVVYGANDPKAGAVVTLYRLLEDERLNHRCEVVSGILAEECGQLLSEFFRERRRRETNEHEEPFSGPLSAETG